MVLVSVVEHKAVGSGWRHDQPEDSERRYAATILIDSCPPLEHSPKRLVLHGKISVSIFAQRPVRTCPTVCSGIGRARQAHRPVRPNESVGMATRCRQCGGKLQHNKLENQRVKNIGRRTFGLNY